MRTPCVRLELPGLHEFFLQEASDAQLEFLPPSALFEAQSVNARIRIAADSDTRSMSRVDARRQAIFERARDPIRQASRRTRWVLDPVSDSRLRGRCQDDAARI